MAQGRQELLTTRCALIPVMPVGGSMQGQKKAAQGPLEKQDLSNGQRPILRYGTFAR